MCTDIFDTQFSFKTPHIQSFPHPLALEKNIQLNVLRLDLVHPKISGNKWYKLKYNLKSAISSGADCVASFGGAYSNHIHALATAGSYLGFETVGFIRGQQPKVLSPTLKDATKMGMRLIYLDRVTYREKHLVEKQSALAHQFLSNANTVYWVPEGGSNLLAIKGTQEITEYEHVKQFDYIFVACGSGGTLAGLIKGAELQQQVIGVPVLKGGGFLQKTVEGFLWDSGLREKKQWQLWLDGHWGGYGKTSDQLHQFILSIEKDFSLPLDPIYTGKLVWRVIEGIRHGEILSGSRVLIIHSGGLQGRRGFPQYYS
ncbi:1-aminocyclopropane-1-carboxylate deaminase/D-cysteine desulfhydrase [Zooshikella harenae]|uniref:1-aminocyclopropane-1-carboxylate deaminase/D-cysteine desulfhydrase n=1 Tax=Zooshikella harenae TaxID=2827238 RepID=A0ABS5Z7D0_9GAMM|nr:pyridoxal-phosphate dependent enzyme [Zooshikella harenae]MBU2709955.1 1-aminocyclopropane-1-carboxylate deaminase/D-cysteine desulfhydrase [Zooshikella harenae]